MLFRPVPLALALALLALLLTAAAPSQAAAGQCKGADAAPQKSSKPQARKAMLCLVNKERHSHGLRPLHAQREQIEAAREHTKVMVRDHCFSHQCPGENDLTGRLTHSDYLPCNCSWGIAENIAYGGSSQGSARGIFEAWMHSAEHRANILSGGYQHIGIGVVWGTPASGGDRNSATYTTDFGYRR